jgi:hypothetical protein
METAMTAKHALIAIAAGFIATATLAPANAEDYSWTGPNGGTVNGTWTGDGQTGSGTVAVVGPNGGTGSGNIACAQGAYRAGCAHNWTYTDAAGDTWNGGGATGIGPYRGAHVGAVAGPNGAAYARGVWRR